MLRHPFDDVIAVVAEFVAARTYGRPLGLRVVALSDACARREHLVCVRDLKGLPPHARRLVQHLIS